MLKHFVLAGAAFPLSFVGYHFASHLAGTDGEARAASRTIADVMSDFALGTDYDLSDLEVLERDLYYVEQRYVAKNRLDAEAMFQGALDYIERQINEVMFVREPGGKRLQVSVGAYTTVLLLEPIDSFDDLHAQLRRVAAILEDHLSEDTKLVELEYAAVNGALSTLDPHTILLPPVQANEMEVDNQGEFGGLGIEITVKDGFLTVKQPLDGTPADRAGLKASDQIVRIEDESTLNMDLNEAVSKLRGEVGSPVNITVKRKQFTSPRPFTIIRDVIRINPVEGELLEGDIGYVRIKAFHGRVSSDLDELLSLFARETGKGLQGLILDLRSNPGGYLNQAVEVANRFLFEGVIVSTVEGGDRRRDVQRATRAGTQPQYPVVVLVNGNSASASEIVAGALRNQDRAIIVGERTFGKGSVQHLYRNRDESSLKLTVAKYLTPGDHSIQSVGIPPDIWLQPSIVRGPEEGDEDPNPFVSLYWRQWLDREASLDHHLEQGDDQVEDATFAVRYLKPALDPDDDDSDSPKTDWEVGLAKDVLLAAQGSRRVEVLRSAKETVQKRQHAEAELIEKAFSDLGIDWTNGENPDAVELETTLSFSDSDLLLSGESQSVTLTVTNRSAAPVFQLSAVTESDNPWLDHREFYLGRLGPGETRTYTQQVSLHYGYGAEIAPVTVTFRSPQKENLATSSLKVSTEGKELPRFAYSLRLVDDGSGKSTGNGDGLPQAGEVIDLEVTVTNIGNAATGLAYGRVKNRSGRNLDLRIGSMSLGEPLDAEGQACAVEDDGCEVHLQPGEDQVGRLTFELREPPEDGYWEIELLLGDNEHYDYRTVQRGGFYDYFQLNERVKLLPGQPLDGRKRAPPSIEVTRQPELLASSIDAVMSGVVKDDRGVRDVMLFHGDDKIFFRGGTEGTSALPFSVEPKLNSGNNDLFVLARDFDGLTATWSVGTWLDNETQEDQAEPTER